MIASGQLEPVRLLPRGYLAARPVRNGHRAALPANDAEDRSRRTYPAHHALAQGYTDGH